MTIQADGLSRTFEGRTVVDALTFQILPGQIFGLLGGNGAGKSTTLRMLATLLTPTSGEARVGGYSVRTESIQVRRNLGYVTGDTGLYGRLTPRELLRFSGELYGCSASRIGLRTEELAEGLQFRKFLDQKCETLSTGQSQRINLARALLHEPPYLILDEPTSGLDILSAQFMLDYLKAEKENGRTILFSTHILSEAELLCDTLGILHEGTMLSIGSLPDTLAKWGAESLLQAMLHATRRPMSEDAGVTG